MSKTLKYLKGSFLLLGVVCLPGAIIFSLLLDPVLFLTFIPEYASGEITSFFTAYGFIGDFSLVIKVYPMAIIVIVLFLTFCATMSIIEHHFRTGKLLAKKVVSGVNHYFIPMLKVLLCLAIVSAVYYVILCSLVSLQHLLFSGFGSAASMVSIIIATVIALVMFFLFFWICTPLIFLAPLMQNYGYTFSDALSISVSYYGDNQARILMGLIFVFLAIALIYTALSIFNLSAIAMFIIQVLLDLFLIMYIAAYSMVTTFEVAGIERRDDKKYFQLQR